jgi:zinc transport system ATP-binding protein
MKQPIIDVKNISYAYGDHKVLEGVSFSVEEGDYVGLIGPNGSGKSTLLRIMLNLLPHPTGEVTMFGQPITKLKDRYLIGYVPQRITQADIQFPATVEEVVATGRVARVGMLKLFSAADKAAIKKAMHVTGIAKYAKRRIGNLSGGERQRVFIARALASEPKLLILDEPTVGVDIASQESFYTLLCELNTKHKLTIVLVSHDIDVVAQEVKTVLFLNKKVVSFGSPKDILKHGVLEELYGGNMKLIEHHHGQSESAE